MWDNENQRPVAAKVGYMNETSIEDEKNVYDQMVKKLGAKKKYLLKVHGYDRIFKVHCGIKTDEHHDWIITSVKGLTFRDVLGQPEAEWLPHALSAAKCVPSCVAWTRAWPTHYTDRVDWVQRRLYWHKDVWGGGGFEPPFQITDDGPTHEASKQGGPYGTQFFFFC